MFRYSIAKTANILFAQELQRRFDNAKIPILCTSVHPGAVDSGDVGDIFRWYIRPIVSATQITNNQGAITPTFAAVAKQVRKDEATYRGKYLQPYGQVGTPHRITKDHSQAKLLWERTAAEVEGYLQKNNLDSIDFM
jgi:NAD(P)-dependent dehydrogenase (short-subunit alcohol dehydrogenase family)